MSKKLDSLESLEVAVVDLEELVEEEE